MDFFTTTRKPPSYYTSFSKRFKETKAYLYRWRQIYKLRSVRYAFADLVFSLLYHYQNASDFNLGLEITRANSRYMFGYHYDGSMVAFPPMHAGDPTLRSWRISKYRKEYYGDTYQYNPNYRALLRQLKYHNPRTKFIVFTTPVITDQFCTLIQCGRLPDYEHWIKDIVAVMDNVYNFMYPNSITSNLDMFYDAHHLNPGTGAPILVRRLLGKGKPTVPGDFGELVSSKSLQMHLNKVRKLSLKTCGCLKKRNDKDASGGRQKPNNRVR